MGYLAAWQNKSQSTNKHFSEKVEKDSPDAVRHLPLQVSNTSLLRRLKFCEWAYTKIEILLLSYLKTCLRCMGSMGVKSNVGTAVIDKLEMALKQPVLYLKIVIQTFVWSGCEKIVKLSP
jgi:hypothetical protein